MAILDTIFRTLLSQLIFRPRAARHLAGPARSTPDADRRLYAAETNHWGRRAPEPATRSFLDPPPADGVEVGERARGVTPAGPRRRRFGLPAATAIPAPSGLLACGAVDRHPRSFSDRRRR
ncbi:MAG: hypothetical protein V3T72_07885 [Thermoanaerobaculia bacterium]